MKGVDTQMLSSQVPGGMLSNLESQLKELNKIDLFEDVINEIPKVREDFGFLFGHSSFSNCWRASLDECF